MHVYIKSHWSARVVTGFLAYQAANSRHDTRHTDQTVDTAETDADAPQSRTAYDPLTQSNVSSSETQHCTCSICLLVMQISVKVVLQSWEIDVKAERIEVGRDHGSREGLTVESDRQCFKTTKEEEGIEGSET